MEGVDVDIMSALVLILNDEHPEIRGYLVQCDGAKKLVNERYGVES